MPNLDFKYITDENGNRVLPITHVNAVRDSSGNTLPSLMAPEKNGSGIGTCSTSSGTALTVSLTGYELVKNGFVAVTFANDVPAGATLNVNSKGAKPIIYKGSAITADTIKADDTAMFAYDGTNYVVTSLGEGGGSAAGLEIVAASGTTLNAEVGKYYRYDSDVTTLAVTLPTITGATEVQEFKLGFTTGEGNISVTFTGGTIEYFNYFIDELLSCEITLYWDGDVWKLIEESKYDILGTRVAYLESTGCINYFDTGIDMSTLDYKIMYYGGPMVMGWVHQNVPGGTWICLEPSVKKCYYGNSRESATVSTCSGSANDSFTYDMSKGFYYNNTQLASFTCSLSSDSISGNTLKIGCWYDFKAQAMETTQMSSLVQKFYHVIIKNGNDDLVRDFIPVRVGQVGYLYDKVSKTLFANQGTGSFTLGPDI